MNHTPGPWKFLGTAIGVAHQGQGGEADAMISLATLPHPSDMDPSEWLANALLIAAAPDLLELARAFLSYLEDDYRSVRRRAECIAAARAAIAKATP